MSPEKPDALLWMDVETTGLDANKCSILEIGLRCTTLDAMREHALLEAVVHISRKTVRFIKDMSGMYTLHPAGTNIQRFDLPIILRFCATAERIDDLLSYRALDLTALRLTAKTLGRDPYTHRAKPTHRVHDCLDRDIAEYRHYLTLMNPKETV
ncbi:MAG: hypothetical protein OGM57_00415 [Bifidobacteriaceae bacterium]|nr:MAG: hypothetical protein OGM57_00415 [Bifidobacteriaceae bacterium]